MTERNLVDLVNTLAGGRRPWEVELSDVSSAARHLLGVSAVSLMIVSPSAAHALVAASDGNVDALEQLAVVVGESPGSDAVRDGATVMIGDVACERERWPQLVAIASARGVAAMFVFPLRIGPVSIGTLTLYRDEPGELPTPTHVLTLAVADAVVEIVLAAQAHAQSDDGLAAPLASLVAQGAVVDQAVGMVVAQLDCDLVEAAIRLRAHAYSHDQPLLDVARAVVERRLRLER